MTGASFWHLNGVKSKRSTETIPSFPCLCFFVYLLNTRKYTRLLEINSSVCQRAERYCLRS